MANVPLFPLCADTDAYARPAESTDAHVDAVWYLRRGP